jgi:5-hydroxyisourate hydrolase
VSAAITTHVLDTARGRPAAGVSIALESAAGERVGAGVTDADGRLRDLGSVEPGHYRLTFDTGGYFAAGGEDGFYPEVVVNFTVTQGEDHYHVPLLLNPYGYSTYRGS